MYTQGIDETNGCFMNGIKGCPCIYFLYKWDNVYIIFVRCRYNKKWKIELTLKEVLFSTVDLISNMCRICFDWFILNVSIHTCISAWIVYSTSLTNFLGILQTFQEFYKLVQFVKIFLEFVVGARIKR